ncbi:MAG: DinB family protein [Gemmatimonadaceae bacterium]|nr:DinB family protein [Gemmatimonadaceae bacterium]MBA3557163.1 DinB family protein [Gemmatimonadaceae bacterium]
MSNTIVGLPERSEAAPYYFTYIDRVQDPDIISVLESQLDTTLEFGGKISDDRSLHRYAQDKWSIREVMSHVNDTERLFVFRALWFARGFASPLPSFDQNTAVGGAVADQIPWARHLDEFRVVRLATLAFFKNLPRDAWMRRGIASDNPFTVRALAYIAAGHLSHHAAVLGERYMEAGSEPA